MPSIFPMVVGRAHDVDLTDGPGMLVLGEDGVFVTAEPLAADDPRLSDERQPVDESVTLAKLVDGLVPSRGASPVDEAVRALGTAGGTAAAGNDARFAVYSRVQDENGANLPARSRVSVQGAAIAATDDEAGDRTIVTVTTAGGGYDRMQEEGGNVTQRPTLNFVGPLWTVADDAANNRTNVTFADSRREGHTFAIVGPSARAYPGFAVVLTVVGRTKKLAGAYVRSDASAPSPLTYYVRKNGATMTGWGTALAPLSSDGTPGAVDPADITVGEGDFIDLVIMSPGVATWFALTLVDVET